MNRSRLAAAVMLGAIAATAAVYWPILRGALVWDDLLCLRDQAWLREEHAWQRIFAADFCSWTNYFRPAAVALFTLESRLFGTDPGPMHALSLGIHLANMLLVGLAARALSVDQSNRAAAFLPGAVMLLYGLHPALLESVAWISAQTELAVTFFMLLAVFLNLKVHRSALRAASVATCFLLAACSKESAISLPLLLPIVDWLTLPSTSHGSPWQSRLFSLLRRQWATYLGIIVAGLAYLALRFWALGYVLHSVDAGAHQSWFARLQETAWSYLTYWRILIWPMLGLNPIHLIDEQQFALLDASHLLFDLGALAIMAYGAVALCKHSFLGGIIVAVTVLLFPVLHVLPVSFDESLYHERYVMAPLAAALILLPRLIGETQQVRILRLGFAGVLAIWLAAAVVNVRIILPLWANDTLLWQWALRSNQASVSARENLLANYITEKSPLVHDFADALIADPVPCPTCMLNLAYFSMSEGNAARATAALERLKADRSLAHDNRLRQAYGIARAHLLEMRGDMLAAEQAYRDAEAADPREPMAQMQLALFLAHAGRADESHQAEESALLLFPPEQREQRRKEFEEAVAEKSAVTASPN